MKCEQLSSGVRDFYCIPGLRVTVVAFFPSIFVHTNILFVHILSLNLYSR